MIVLVFGGRTYRDRVRIFAELDALHARRPITKIIQGKAQGADEFARNWAISRGVPTDDYAADWSDMQAQPCIARQRYDGSWYNAAAGGIRNRRMMVEGKPDVALEFPGGPGTANMRGICRAEVILRPSFVHVTIKE